MDATRGKVAKEAWNKVAERYNEEYFAPEKEFLEHREQSSIDPSVSRDPRKGDWLKSQMARLRSQYIACYKNWSTLGQNDPITFYHSFLTRIKNDLHFSGPA